MRIHIIGTGSKGNCYVLEDSNKLLILDAGISFDVIIEHFSRIKEPLSISNIQGCLITHEHGDHIEFAKQFAAYGIKIFLTLGTFQKSNLSTNEICLINTKESFNTGQFIFSAFKSFHNAAEPVNYYIKTDSKRILYFTDTGKLPYQFNFKIDCMLCEVNYCDDIIENNMIKGSLNAFLFARIIEDHLSKRQVLEFVGKHKTLLKYLVIIHASKSNLNQKEIAADFIKKFGIPSKLAVKNDIIYI